MTVREIIAKINVTEEIHIVSKGTGMKVGMIPAVIDRDGKFTRETEDWMKNNWVYVDEPVIFSSPKKLSKEESESILSKEEYEIGTTVGPAIVIYI